MGSLKRSLARRAPKGGGPIKSSGLGSSTSSFQGRRAGGLRIGFAFNLKPADTPAAPNGNSSGTTPRPHHRLPRSAGQSNSGSAIRYPDTYAEWDDESTIGAIEAALEPMGTVTRLEVGPEFPTTLAEAAPDVVFNVSEGLGGACRESYAPAFCEFWGVPYTGSDPLTLALCLDKSLAKQVLSHRGIPTPEFTVVRAAGDPIRPIDLPAIVKPLHEGSSKGITQRSLCYTPVEVEAEVARLIEDYEQPAIVERFLDGREFTVALLGNRGDCRVFPIVELDFGTLPSGSKPIYGYEAKWIWDRPEAPLDVFQCPAECGPRLQRRIEELAIAAFDALGCRDWARIDVRCDAEGTPHIIEVNPLPGVIPDPRANSCYPKAARAAGVSYDEVIRAVLCAAAARYGLPVPV